MDGQSGGGGQVGNLDGLAKLDRVNEGLTTSRQCFTIGNCNFNKKMMWSETRQRAPYSLNMLESIALVSKLGVNKIIILRASKIK